MYCPEPSSLNRPHPPRSRAHHNFTAWRLICDAFAVRERLGDPRAAPGFHCTFLPDMPPPETPGSSTSSVPGSDVDIGLRQALSGSALPKSLQSVSRKVSISGLSRFTHLLRPASLLAPHARIRPASRPSGTFTTRLPTGRSPFPLLAITTTATGLLCWWDSHPREWQLASLHQSYLTMHGVSSFGSIRIICRIVRRGCPPNFSCLCTGLYKLVESPNLRLIGSRV